MRTKLIALAVAGIAVLCPGVESRADLIVVPGNYETTEGSSGNAMPLHVGEIQAYSSARYQQVFAASEFGTTPLIITGVAFRPDATFGSAFGPTTLNSVVVQLSTSQNGVDSLSVVFANNTGTDMVTVFSGSLTLSSSFTGPGGGPKDFDIVIPFATYFRYDPTDGDLLLDITNPNNLETTWIDTASQNGDSVSRAFGSSGDSSGAEDSNGLVASFTAVPEPATLLLLGLGLAGLALARRRIRGPSPGR